MASQESNDTVRTANALDSKRLQKGNPTFSSDQRAVSSVIGTVLMISVTVSVFGAVSLLVFAEVNEGVQNETTELVAQSNGANSLIVRHTGGEPLTLSQSVLLSKINGTVTSNPMTSYSSQIADGANWRIGEYVCVVGTGASCTYGPGANVQGLQIAHRNTIILVHGEPLGAAAVTSEQIDLVPSNVALSTTTPDTSELVTFTVDVKNQGSAAVTAGNSFTVVLRVDSNVVDTETVNGPLAAGATTQVALQWTTTTEGGHPYTVTVDDGSAITESNESNNIHTDAISVGPPLPDLRPSAVVISPSPVTVSSGTATFATTITNDGPGDITGAQSFTVVLRVAGVVKDTETVNGPIAASGTSNVNLEWTSIVAGNSAYTITVDDGTAITEADETDNVHSGTISVSSAVFDPGFAYLDINEDGLYSAADGDTSLSLGDINTGYDAANNCGCDLVIPPTVGAISYGNHLHYEGPQAIKIYVDLTATSSNSDVRLTSTAGSVFVNSGVTLTSGSNKGDVELEAATTITANGVTLIGGSSSSQAKIEIGKGTNPSGDISLVGSTMKAGNKIDVTGDADIDCTNCIMESGNNDLHSDDSDTVDTVTVQGGRFRNYAGSPSSVDVQNNAELSGTPAEGTAS